MFYKKSKTVLIIFVILILILVGVGYYSIKNHSNNLEEKEHKENSMISQKEINELMKQIEIYNKELAVYYPLKSVNNIENQDLLYFAYSVLNLSLDESFTANQLDDIVTKYFGNGRVLIHENMMCRVDNTPFFVYHENEKKYTYSNEENIHGHDIMVGKVANNKVYYLSSSITTNNEIEMKVKVLYSNYCEGGTCPPNNAYYRNFLDSKNHRNAILGDYNSDNTVIITEEAYRKIENQLPITTYTFQKNTVGNYGLVKVEISD